MADTAFEAELEALFETASPMADETRFAESVGLRLRRRFLLRRIALVAATLAAAWLALPGLGRLTADERLIPLMQGWEHTVLSIWSLLPMSVNWTALGLAGAALVALDRLRHSDLLS